MSVVVLVLLQAVADAKAAQYNCTIGIGVCGGPGVQPSQLLPLVLGVGTPDQPTYGRASSWASYSSSVAAWQHAKMPLGRAQQYRIAVHLIALNWAAKRLRAAMNLGNLKGLQYKTDDATYDRVRNQATGAGR